MKETNAELFKHVAALARDVAKYIEQQDMSKLDVPYETSLTPRDLIRERVEELRNDLTYVLRKTK